eukprot:3056106-Amphidinium_carterae.1
MDTPLIQQWKSVPSRHLPQQQEVLPVPLFQWMLEQARDIRKPNPTGQAVAAAILLRAALSCLRHQHMLRASIDIDA